MTIEDIKKIQKAIKQAEAPKLVEARNKHTEEQRKVQDVENQKHQNEAILRSTGVVDLFVQLRDSRTLVISNSGSRVVNGHGYVGYSPSDSSNEIPLPFSEGITLSYTPAIVCFSRDHAEISIGFDRYQSGYKSFGQDDGPKYSDRHLIAKVSIQGQLTINGTLVNNNLIEVVQNSVLEAKGLV